MNWNRVGTNGMQSGEYRVGKFAADEGALCTLYGLWHKDDRLGYFSDFDSAQVAAEEHAKANLKVSGAEPLFGEASVPPQC